VPSSRKILLIGGSGFVSGTLARAAVASGHQVWAVTRGHKTLREGVTGIVADRKDRSAFAKTIAETGLEWDLVVDCICYVQDDAGQDIAVFSGRARHFIMVSTDFVFGPAGRSFPQNEDNPFVRKEIYGGQKRLCELEFINSDIEKMAWTIVRPCHIYGPGSLLGCLPLHGRDNDLIPRMKRGEPLKLVGGGHFLQQPVFCADLANLILSSAGNDKTYGSIYITPGPDIIESRRYYEIIAGIIGVPIRIQEISVQKYLAAFPGNDSYICHRFYDTTRLSDHGLAVPATSIVDGLHAHVMSIVQ